MTARPSYRVEDVRALLRRKIFHLAGGGAEWAEKHGVSPQYVNDVVHGRRLPGKKITAALGLEKRTIWVFK